MEPPKGTAQREYTAKLALRRGGVRTGPRYGGAISTVPTCLKAHELYQKINPRREFWVRLNAMPRIDRRGRIGQES